MREGRLPCSVEVKLFGDLKAMFLHEGSINIVCMTNNSVIQWGFRLSGPREVRTIPHNQVQDGLDSRSVDIRKATRILKPIRCIDYTMNVQAQLLQICIHLFDLCLDRLQDIRSIYFTGTWSGRSRLSGIIWPPYFGVGCIACIVVTHF